MLRVSKRKIAWTFDVPEALLPFDVPPRYNIAPTQQVLAVRQPTAGAEREAVLLKWGLVPPWAKDPRIGVKHINARSETAAEKPSFRSAFKKKRCLIPTDGFYEWQKVGKHKQPFLFTVEDGDLFAFAGLWEQWEGEDGEIIESCAVLTTEANERVRPVHDRMPVILPAKDYAAWLDPNLHDPETLQPLLRPYPAEKMAVRTRGNRPRNDEPECVKSVGTGEGGRSLWDDALFGVIANVQSDLHNDLFLHVRRLVTRSGQSKFRKGATMRRIICVLVVLSTPLLLVAADSDDVRKEFKALEGKWKAVALEAVGKPLPKEAVPDFTFIVGADGMSSGKMPKGEYEAKMSVDPKKNPKTIDNVHETGVHKGKKQFGIYKLEGDKWTVCMTPPGAAESDRPKDFTTKDSTNVVFVFERIKEDKKP